MSVHRCEHYIMVVTQIQGRSVNQRKGTKFKRKVLLVFKAGRFARDNKSSYELEYCLRLS